MADRAQPLVAIVILNWNGWRDTLECLASLRTLAYPNYHVFVVDNASSDDSEAKIGAAFPDVTMIQSGANRGFAGGNNVGIRSALASGAEYVWLLNNDTLVRPEALSALVRRAESDPRIGFVGSKILYADQPDRIWFAGGTLSERNGVTNHVGMNQRDDGNVPIAGETGYAVGTSLLARRQVIEEIGLVPEQYFLYMEEVDWEYTGRQRGWKIWYEPASVVLHKVSASIGHQTPFQVFYLERARAIFVMRHLPKALLASTLFSLRYHLLRHLAHGQPRMALASVRGLASGVAYGLRHRHEGVV
jgi:GT2 family glycosyltransferase